MRKVRILLAVIILAFLCLSGWWWAVATSHEKAVEHWLAQQRDAGWVAETADLSVSGYPNRVDMTLHNIELVDPQEGWAWFGDEFQTFMLTYQPNKLIAAWPGEQVFASPYGELSLNGDLVRASVSLASNTALSLEQIVFETKGLSLKPDAGASGPAAGIWQVEKAISGVRAASDVRKVENAYDIYLNADGVIPPAKLRDFVGGDLPVMLDQLQLDATAVLDSPLDRYSIEDRPAAPKTIWIRDLTGKWGPLALEGEGRVDMNADGYPQGKIDLTLRGWKDMLKAMQRSGQISADLASQMKTAFGLLEFLSGERGTIKAPLLFKSQTMFLGPVPIGTSPRFRPAQE